MTTHIIAKQVNTPTSIVTTNYETPAGGWWLGKLNSCYPISGDTSVPYLYTNMGQIYKNAVVLSSYTKMYIKFAPVTTQKNEGYLVKHVPDKYGLYIQPAAGTAATEFHKFWEFKNFTLKYYKSSGYSLPGLAKKLTVKYNIKRNDEIKNPLEEPDFWISYNSSTSTWTEPTNKHYWSWAFCPIMNGAQGAYAACIFVQKQKVLWFNHQLAEIEQPAAAMQIEELESADPHPGALFLTNAKTLDLNAATPLASGEP